jgi:hypothetical protein
MHDERMQILKMLEEKKISAEEAARLLDAVGEGEPQQPQQEPHGGKRLRVKVTDPGTGKQKVNLRIPLGLAKIAAKFIPPKAKKQLAEEGVDVDEVLSQVMSENIGKIVDIESDDGLVEISIE